MDQDDLKMWCESNNKKFPDMKLIGVAELSDYQLEFNYYSSTRNGGAANIVECRDKKVYGLLFDVTEDIRDNILRPKEGYCNYYCEIKISVKCNCEIYHEAISYKVVPVKEKNEHQPPTKEYMNLILNNAKKFSFPEEYIEYLESIPCLS